MQCKHCTNCDITVYWDELAPSYCDQCGGTL